ncbi:MAG: molybdopterin dinucleotide binding domain-containing protein, partial [Solirubrobacterales bacterium]
MQSHFSNLSPATWTDAFGRVAAALSAAKRLFLISDLQTGALADVMRQFHAATGLPGAVIFYEPFAYEALRAANMRFLGQSGGQSAPNWGPIPRYRLQDCDLILSFGADFLETWISNVEFAWQFAQMHHRSPDYRGEMIYIGPRLSMTAANADTFIQVPPGQEHYVALAILREATGAGQAAEPIPGISPEVIRNVARRFMQAKNSVALGGPAAAVGSAAERLATVVMQLNQSAGRIGTTIDFSQMHALGATIPPSQLVEMLAGLGHDDLVIFHESNPAYSLPQVRESLGRAARILYLGTMMNETASLADWVLPVLSPLEAWGDYEPWTGVHCLMQPTMGPLYDVRHSGDILLSLASAMGRPLEIAGQRVSTFRDWLTLRWRQLQKSVSPDTAFEVFWQQALRKGGVTEESGGQKKAEPAAPTPEEGQVVSEGQPASEGIQLWLWPSILLFDGRLANRGWLQEVPERMSTIAWQSWADISPATARDLDVADGDIIEISSKAGAVQAPARVTSDITDNVVALAIGQGHTALGEVAMGRGANAFTLLSRDPSGSLFGAVQLRKTGKSTPLIKLSADQSQHERHIIRWTAPTELASTGAEQVEEIIWPGPAGYIGSRDLYPPHYYPNHRWAMVVDLDRCIGCGACAVACYAENNIPVMGPERLLKGREMAWLKVVPYRHPNEPLRTGFLPLPCQHCDAAPCEPVCPVFAAVHNEEGLNAQIYNRCIGTRYCSNNCPYKVRRFGWFDPKWRPPLNLQLNPDVNVRCRGVMEKCTFCIQRILNAEHRAKAEGRALRDGEIQPACVPKRGCHFLDKTRKYTDMPRIVIEHRGTGLPARGILAPGSGRETPMNIASPPSGAVVAMPTPSPKLDPLWDRLREQAEAMVRAAPELGGL